MPPGLDVLVPLKSVICGGAENLTGVKTERRNGTFFEGD